MMQAYLDIDVQARATSEDDGTRAKRAARAPIPSPVASAGSRKPVASEDMHGPCQ